MHFKISMSNDVKGYLWSKGLIMVEQVGICHRLVVAFLQDVLQMRAGATSLGEFLRLGSISFFLQQTQDSIMMNIIANALA